MFRKIEHIGIAVKDMNNSNELFEKLLGTSSYKIEQVLSEGVNSSFFKVGESKIELLSAENENSPIAKFIEKKGEGFQLLNEEPKKGADNKLICFVHPKSANGVLVELCQEIS
mgnify:CR=1 FL=1